MGELARLVLLLVWDDFEDRDVESFVVPDDPYRERLIIAIKRDLDLVGVLDHVVVRHDEAVGADDDARTEAWLPAPLVVIL